MTIGVAAITIGVDINFDVDFDIDRLWLLGISSWLFVPMVIGVGQYTLPITYDLKPATHDLPPTHISHHTSKQVNCKLISYFADGLYNSFKSAIFN
jgi:hypothetical protein